MALTTVDLSSTFQYNQSPKRFKFEDTTDYTGQSVALADVTGVFTSITGPNGLIYSNTNHGSPDIDPDVSLINTSINLPLDASGNVLEGTYTVVYEVQDTSGTPFTVSTTKTHTLSYTAPTVNLSLTVDIIAPLLTSTDNTNYTVNLINPTIVRDHDIFYPAALEVAPIEGTTKQVTTDVIYVVANKDLQYSSRLTADITYDLDTVNDWHIEDQISGEQYLDVNADGQICDVYCCIRKQWNRYLNEKAVGNELLAKQYLQDWIVMIGLSKLISDALVCGKTEDISAYSSKILEIGNCEPGCSCEGDEPQLVTGLSGGGSQDTIVVAAGNGVTVSSASGGGITTYTVSMNGTLFAKLNASYNTTITAGTGISVLDSGIISDIRNYQISSTASIVEKLDAIVTLTLPSGGLPTFAIDNFSRKGSSFQDITQVNPNEFIVNKNPILADYDSFSNAFTIANFTPSTIDYYPECNLIQSVLTNGVSEDFDVDGIQVQIIAKNADDFDIRFVDGSLQPIIGRVLSEMLDSITIVVKINA